MVVALADWSCFSLFGEAWALSPLSPILLSFAGRGRGPKGFENSEGRTSPAVLDGRMRNAQGLFSYSGGVVRSMVRIFLSGGDLFSGHLFFFFLDDDVLF